MSPGTQRGRNKALQLHRSGQFRDANLPAEPDQRVNDAFRALILRRIAEAGVMREPE